MEGCDTRFVWSNSRPTMATEYVAPERNASSFALPKATAGRIRL